MYKKAKTVRIDKYAANEDTFYFKHSGRFEYIQRLLAKASRPVDIDDATQFPSLIGY